MPSKVEFFYDLSSPWTRIAFHNIEQILTGSSAQIVWRPVLVGGIFNAVNQQVYAARAAQGDNRRMALTFEWMKEWADLAGVAMNFPSAHHPLKSVHAMRFCCVLEPEQQLLRDFTEAAFEAYFRDQRNLDEIAVLQAIADECGLDGWRLRQQAQEEGIKQRLRDSTQEAIDRGAFGSPTIFVDDEHMYFGNDQLPLVLQRVNAAASKR